MDRNEVFEQVRDATVTVLGVDRDAVTEEARFFADLDADSLDLVELVMALEEKFDVSIPEDDLDGINTVGNALDLLLGKLGAPTP
jgi:acyl carrier protein